MLNKRLSLSILMRFALLSTMLSWIAMKSFSMVVLILDLVALLVFH